MPSWFSEMANPLATTFPAFAMTSVVGLDDTLKQGGWCHIKFIQDHHPPTPDSMT